MTTIATDGLSMAADGLATVHDMVASTDTRKMMRLRDGRIVGLAGKAAQLPVFIAWLQGDIATLPFDDDFSALVLGPSGTLFSYQGLATMMAVQAPYAIGTGRELALGAMAAGASPEQAVRIACTRDIYTGGTVSVLHARSPDFRAEAAPPSSMPHTV